MRKNCLKIRYFIVCLFLNLIYKIFWIILHIPQILLLNAFYKFPLIKNCVSCLLFSYIAPRQSNLLLSRVPFHSCYFHVHIKCSTLLDVGHLSEDSCCKCIVQAFWYIMVLKIWNMINIYGSVQNQAIFHIGFCHFLGVNFPPFCLIDLILNFPGKGVQEHPGKYFFYNNFFSV